MENKKLQMPLMIGIGALAVIMLVLVIISAAGGVNKKGKVTKATDVKDSEIEAIQNYALDSWSSTGKKSKSSDKTDDQTTTEVTTSDITDGDYVIGQSATNNIGEGNVKDLTAKQLTYARNEIYARHGKKFESTELQNYFNSKTWYTASDTYADSDLSAIETANAAYILQYQQDNNKMYTPN